MGRVIMMLFSLQFICYGIVTGKLNTTNSALPVPGENGVKAIEIGLLVLVGVGIAMLIAEGILFRYNTMAVGACDC